MFEREEVLRLICLDNMQRVINSSVMSRGTVNATPISHRRILEEVIRVNASAVILMHNHVNAPALPSAEDIKATKELARLLESTGVKLQDHIIVSGSKYYSMASQPLMLRL